MQLYLYGIFTFLSIQSSFINYKRSVVTGDHIKSQEEVLQDFLKTSHFHFTFPGNVEDANQNNQHEGEENALPG